MVHRNRSLIRLRMDLVLSLIIERSTLKGRARTTTPQHWNSIDSSRKQHGPEGVCGWCWNDKGTNIYIWGDIIVHYFEANRKVTLRILKVVFTF